MKTHLDTGAKTALCGRGPRVTTSVRSVTCSLCMDKPAYQEAYRAMKAAQDADFQAQTPRQVPSIWDHRENYVCTCGGDLFREKPRSLHSYHFVCEACGRSIHPLTETGMCQ